MKQWTIEELINRLIRTYERGYPLPTISSIDEGNKAEIRVRLPESVHSIIAHDVGKLGTHKSLNGWLVEAALMKIELQNHMKDIGHPAVMDILNKIKLEAITDRSRARDRVKRSLNDIAARINFTQDSYEREELIEILRENSKSSDKPIAQYASDILRKLDG